MKEKQTPEKEVLTQLHVRTQPSILKAMLKKLNDNPQIKEPINVSEDNIKSITFFIEE